VKENEQDERQEMAEEEKEVRRRWTSFLRQHYSRYY